MVDAASTRCDVLVVGAGPTGLTLAATLRAYGTSVRLVDRADDRVHESRALAVQARSLEVLRAFGIVDELVARGNPAVDLRLHSRGRVARVRLFDIGVMDTAYPFVLFVSQAETEALLGEHLRSRGVEVERGVELVSLTEKGDDVTCELDGRHGVREVVCARYVVGCDGAHSTVRRLAGIPFSGGRYPQTFLLADLDVEGLEPGTLNAFVTEKGPLLFFPLGRPAPWRLIAMRPTPAGQTQAHPAAETATGAVSLGELQALCDQGTAGTLHLGEPVWATAFSLYHRHADRYRTGRLFVAGDAAHIHSPAGAQGMNTGIQDAWNLGWKLALVCRGAARQTLLESYDEERRPVGAFVVRFTDRAFRAATLGGPVARLLRSYVVPAVMPLALRVSRGRAIAFRTVSQLGIRYRNSSAVLDDTPRWRRGPRPGDRLPDAALVTDGSSSSLHGLVSTPGFHLLLYGDPSAWDRRHLSDLRPQHSPLLGVHHITRQPAVGAWHDARGLVAAPVASRRSSSRARAPRRAHRGPRRCQPCRRGGLPA